MIDAWLGAETGLAALFLASFLSATLLPGGSELVLIGVLKLAPTSYWWAVGIATAGNTLGGLTSVLVGRLLPNRLPQERALQWVRRRGALVLILSWVPIIGDALCVAAGWLRIAWLPLTLFLVLGKFLRYLVVAEAARAAFN